MSDRRCNQRRPPPRCPRRRPRPCQRLRSLSRPRPRPHRRPRPRSRATARRFPAWGLQTIIRARRAATPIAARAAWKRGRSAHCQRRSPYRHRAAGARAPARAHAATSICFFAGSTGLPLSAGRRGAGMRSKIILRIFVLGWLGRSIGSATATFNGWIFNNPVTLRPAGAAAIASAKLQRL